MPAAQEKPIRLVTTAKQPALDPSQLPPATDQDIKLDITNRAESEQTWRLNASEWKGFLEEPSYFDRELFLLDAELAGNGSATSWLLTSSKLPVN